MRRFPAGDELMQSPAEWNGKTLRTFACLFELAYQFSRLFAALLSSSQNREADTFVTHHTTTSTLARASEREWK